MQTCKEDNGHSVQKHRLRQPVFGLPKQDVFGDGLALWTRTGARPLEKMPNDTQAVRSLSNHSSWGALYCGEH